MSEPTPALPRVKEWWTRPRVVLPIILALLALVTLFMPQAADETGDARLSTHLAGSLGARMLYETAERLGWQVSQRDTSPIPDGRRGATIHAVLAPPRPISPEDAHAYLDAVRAGDGLLLVLNQRNALSDSLDVRHSPSGGFLQLIARDTAGCPDRRELIPPLWPDRRVHLWSILWLRNAPDGRVVFATLRPEDDHFVPAAPEAAAGFELGKGRVVVIADPDLLRNDVIRRCKWGADVRVVRMLEWLRAGGSVPRVAIDFDEFHQGYGRSPSMLRATSRFLTGHPVGRTLLQITLAALVLLLALAPRPIPPVDVERVERRDPLEQIDALAHAYEQVRATRTLAARLLRGVRWRVDRGWPMARARTDDAFLTELASRDPALADDVAIVRRALEQTVPDRDLPELAAALRRIEHTLTTSTSA